MKDGGACLEWHCYVDATGLSPADFVEVQELFAADGWRRDHFIVLPDKDGGPTMQIRFAKDAEGTNE